MQTELGKRESSLAVQNALEARGRELCQEVLEAARHVEVRARPSGLAVESRERTSTKEISKQN
jgi:hypothetical protein